MNGETVAALTDTKPILLCLPLQLVNALQPGATSDARSNAPRLPLEEASLAHELVAGSQVIGKVVIDPNGLART